MSSDPLFSHRVITSKLPQLQAFCSTASNCSAPSQPCAVGSTSILLPDLCAAASYVSEAFSPYHLHFCSSITKGDAASPPPLLCHLQQSIAHPVLLLPLANNTAGRSLMRDARVMLAESQKDKTG
jgi:hypothetical protein